MGLSRGIDEFIRGAIAGREIRQGWDDRKRQQAMEDEDRALQREDAEWARQERQWAREDRARRISAADEDAAWVRSERQRTLRERDRATKMRDEEQQMFSDALAESQKVADTPLAETVSGDSPAPMLSTPAPKRKAEPAAGRASGSSSAKPKKDRATPAQGRAAPAERGLGSVRGVGVVPVPVAAGPAMPVSAGAIAAGAAPGAMAAPASADPAMQAPQHVGFQGAGEIQGPPMEPMQRAIALSRPDPAAPAPVQPAAPSAGGPARGVAAAAPGPAEDPMQAAIRMSTRPAAPGMDVQQAAPAMVEPKTGRALSMPEAAARTPGPAAMSVMSTPRSPDRVPARAPVPSAAPGDPAPTTPSMEIAASTAAAAPSAPSRGVQPDAHVAARRNEQAFIQRYREIAVPKIVEFYLGRGDLEKAQSFQKWADDGASADGMKAWARGVNAATAGDEEGFLDNMVDAYNATGYFDDGYQVIRNKSGFTRDEQGNITGATLTFRNQETGAISSRVFEDVEDIYEMGVNFLSPESVFEHAQEQLAAAAEARAEQAKFERQVQLEVAKEAIKNGGGGEAELRKRIDDTVKMLAETDMQFSALPADQQVAKAVDLIRQKDLGVTALGQVGQGAPTVWRGE